eukprot:15010802-Alexandrium_andersonii.AAC.1
MTTGGPPLDTSLKRKQENAQPPCRACYCSQWCRWTRAHEMLASVRAQRPGAGQAPWRKAH